MFNRENKSHYKMYKKGKFWVTSSITVALISCGMMFATLNNDVSASDDTQLTTQVKNNDKTIIDNQQNDQKSNDVQKNNQNDSDTDKEDINVDRKNDSNTNNLSTKDVNVKDYDTPINSSDSIKQSITDKSSMAVKPTDDSKSAIKLDITPNIDNIDNKQVNSDGINPSTATQAQAGQEFNKYRQQYHYSDQQGAGNDVQTIWQDSTGLWHFYYLHSDTDSEGQDSYTQNGWAHVTSSDLVHFQDCGTAIPGQVDGLWSATWTGSIITNANGFFKNLPQSPDVVIAAISTPRIHPKDGDTGQNIWLLYSLDGGYNFVPMQDHPVVGLPEYSDGYLGDNRDPLIWYNSETNQMEIWLAQDHDHGNDHGVSQFVSDDGINYRYIGRTTISGDGAAFKKWTLVETPGLSRMIDQTTGQTKDVMFFGIQNWDGGPYYNLVNGEGCLAILGHVNDQGLFIPDNSTQDPNDSTNYIVENDSSMFRTDWGSDYYGGSSQYNPDPLKNPVNGVIQNAWLGHWKYSGEKVKDGTPIAIPGTASFRQVYLDNGVIKERWTKLDGSEWKDNDSLNANNVSLSNGKITIANNQSLAQTYSFNLSGTNDPNFSAQFDFTESDGSQHIRVYRVGDELRVAYWRDGGTFLKNTSEWYTMIYGNSLGNKQVTQLNIRTDTQSLEFNFPELGQLYTIMRYTLGDAQNVTVTVNGSNSSVNTITSKNYVGNSVKDVTTTIKYYENGTNNVIGTASVTGHPGDKINVMDNMPSGYTYFSGNLTYTFQYDSLQTIVVNVAKNAENTVIFHFVDQNGKSIETNDGHSTFTWTGENNQTWDYSDWIPSIDGYIYDHITQKNPFFTNHDLKGVYTQNGPTNVYLTYNKRSKVNFYFHDSYGNVIATNDGHYGFTWDGIAGDTWDYNNWVPSINGFVYDHADQYTPDNTNHNLTGTYSSNGDTNVYLIYDFPGIVNVHYHDQNGNEIQPTTTMVGGIATPWSLVDNIPNISGYIYDHADQYNPTYFNHTIDGNYPLYGPTDVYLTYDKVGTVNIHYHDQNGNEIQPTTITNGQVGTSWSLNDNIPQIAGYTYDHADQYNPTYFNHAIDGNYPLYGPTDVYLTYYNNENTGKINIFYHDENGNEIKAGDYQLGKVGTSWSLNDNIPQIAGYVYDHADQYNPTYFNHAIDGNYPLYGPTNVYLTYKKLGKVTVYFHDQKGNEIQSPITIYGKYGDDWNYEKQVPSILGYTYDHADQYNLGESEIHVLNGHFNQNGTDLYLTYDAIPEGRVYVECVDQNGDSLGSQYDFSKFIRQGDKWDISNDIPTIPGYKYAYAISSDSVDGQLSGSFTNGSVWIKLYFQKN